MKYLRSICLAAASSSAMIPSAHAQTQPHIGVPGYTLQTEYQFGTASGNNMRSIADLRTSFRPDATWGRINGELQHFVNFLTTTYAGRAPDPTAAARTHQFETEALVLNSNHLGGAYAWGNIESGAIVSNLTVMRPVIIEVLAQQPKGRAHWPCIWMYDYHSGHATSDEIDILESQFNAPVGVRDDRRHVYQNTHGVFTTKTNYLMDQWGRWNTGVDMSQAYHYYTCHWFANGDLDMYVDGTRTVRRNIMWRPTGGDPNVIVQLSTGSDQIDWCGPIVTNSGNGTDTFSPDSNSMFKIRHIRIFKPAAVISDGFSDGARTNGADSQDVAWYTIGAPASAATVVGDSVTGGIGAGNALKLTPTSYAQGFVANLPSTITLVDGESVTLTFKWRFTGTTNINQTGRLRFGFFNSGGTPTAGDANSTVRANDKGYYAQTNPGSASATGTSLMQETIGDDILGATGTSSAGGNAGASVNGGTTAHTAMLSIRRSGASLVLSASIDGLTAATATVASPLTYSFNEIGMSNGVGNYTTPSPLILDSVQVHR